MFFFLELIQIADLTKNLKTGIGNSILDDCEDSVQMETEEAKDSSDGEQTIEN